MDRVEFGREPVAFLQDLTEQRVERPCIPLLGIQACRINPLEALVVLLPESLIGRVDRMPTTRAKQANQKQTGIDQAQEKIAAPDRRRGSLGSHKIPHLAGRGERTVQAALPSHQLTQRPAAVQSGKPQALLA